MSKIHMRYRRFVIEALPHPTRWEWRIEESDDAMRPEPWAVLARGQCDGYYVAAEQAAEACPTLLVRS